MKELTITAPEGYEIDKQKSTFDKIVFKKIGEKYPTKLEEITREWFIDNCNRVDKLRIIDGKSALFSTKERAEEVLALIQLIAFRDAVWRIDDWKPPVVNNTSERFSAIYQSNGEIKTVDWATSSGILLFKTSETRDWFLNTHKELIEKAKNLL